MTKKPNAAQLNALRAAAMAQEIREEADELEHEEAAPEVLTQGVQGSLDFPDLKSRDFVDGRKLKVSARTKQFATRVKPEVYKQIVRTAKRDGVTIGGLIELAMIAYEMRRSGKG
jgi:hypothetical protein